MKKQTREQILNCSDFNQLLNAEYGERGTQTREQFEAEAEAFVLGEILKQERKSAGLTQQQLAEQSGYNKTTISRLEKGSSNVSLSSIFHIFAGMGRKVAISVLTFLLLLTLGVGQMWADMGFEDSNNGIKFWRVPLGGAGADYRVEHGRTNSTQEAGDVSSLYLKEWYAKLYQNEDNLWGDGHMYYRVYLQGSSAPNFTTSNKSYYNWNSWNNGWRYPTFGNNGLNVDILSGKASGKYVFEYYFDATATSTLYCSNNSSNFKVNFNIKPNALTSFSVSSSGYSAGSGTSADPYIIARGGSLTLTASGSGGTSDSNSSIKYKYGSSEWQTTSYTISNITTDTKTSITVKGARRHNSQDFGSDESSVTIYYKAETTYTVSVTSGSPSSVYAGANYTTPEITASDVTGYHFDHWSTTGGASVASTTTSPTTVTATATGTVTANYEPNAYTITLDDNGSYQGDGSATATYDSGTLTDFNHASRTGWSPSGYYTGASTGSMVIDAGGNLVANVTDYTDASGNWTRASNTKLYARWIQAYAVLYNANGGSGSMSDPNSPYAPGSNVTVLGNSFTRTGYTFTGWNTSAEGDGTPYAAGATITSIAANVTLYAQWSENLTTVTININTAGAGTLTVDDAPFTPGNTTTAGVATTHSVAAVPYPGYRTSATLWTKNNSNISWTSATANPNTITGGGTAGTSTTLTGNFTQTYAYLQGRMTIYTTVARSTKKHIASSEGGWDESSNRMKMDYDGTNHRFYLHTYMTPKELSTEQSGNEQYFWFKTSTSSSSDDTNPIVHRPSTGRTLTAVGTGNKKATETSTGTNSIWFDNTSTTNGYAIIYFDEAGVWYELEHSLVYNVNGGSGTVPSTTCHLNGTNATAGSGSSISKSQYSFAGWNTEQYITGTNYAAGASVPMSANTTLYAKWTRSITLDQNGATTNGSTSVTATYNCATLPAITAPEKTGYTFGGWYTVNNGTGSEVINSSGALQASKSNWTDANSRFTNTQSSATLYAKWTQTITLNANTSNHGSGSNKTATVILNATALSSITHTSAATGYHLVGYYTDATGGTKVLEADGTFASSTVTDYITSSKWTKAGATTLYAHYEANTYTIAFDPNDDNYVGTATGTTASINATYGTSYTLTTNGFSREGYTFYRWTQNADGSGTSYTNGQTGVSNLTSTNGATVTLYAKWTGKTYTVSFNPRGGTCGTASKSVTMGATYGTLPAVTPPTGYVFDGWYTAADGGSKVESTTQVTSANDHTLYAHYIQKAQVYFKNTYGWANVYVTFDASWDGGQGAGNEGKTYRTMTRIEGTDIWYHDIPDSYLSSWAYNIAFNDTYQDGYHAFTAGHAVFREDFDRKATLFIPTSNTNNNQDGNYQKNGVQYYSTGYSENSSGPKYTSGYWRTYNDAYSGYTMTYQKSGGSWSSGHKMEAEKAGENTFVYTVYMDANSQYNFAFYKEYQDNANSRQFRYGTQITSAACTNLELACDPNNAWMQTTVAGGYTFKLTQQNDGHMYLTVEYPFKQNDYRVIYRWNDGSAHEFASEIIRSKASSKDTISVFVHKLESPVVSRSLTIQKCTAIDGSGNPTWKDGNTIDLSSVTQNGVYDFIITQPASGNPTGVYWNKYEGNYYIRTQSSDGGWDQYKSRADNKMTLSEYSMTQTLSAKYSHYYCRFIESTSVDISYTVATDYSPCICPIQYGDATIGNAATTLPASANVRFTWNEETNATVRAYLKDAQGDNARYLVLHGKDGKVYKANGDAIPAAGSGDDDLKANELLFTDLGNWIYQVNLKAQPGAAVSLIAKYNGEDRYLVGGASSWETIIAGSTTTKYDIIAVFDFKTNRLMTAWTPSGTITENLSNVDVLLIRHAQEAGTAITLGSSKTVQSQEVIGAIELRYNELVGHVANWTNASRPLLKYFISFPFDVNVSDIFGLNSAYGEAYIIEKYDGAERASKGFFRGDGTTTFWKRLQHGDVMKANEGYCVILDNDYINGDAGNIWQYKTSGSSVYLYFPSAGNVGNIESKEKTITIPEHTCTIDRSFVSTQAGGRTVYHTNTDSHWNMMGVPVFATNVGDATAGTPGAVFATSGVDGDGNFNYYYKWNNDNTFTISTARGESFKSMHGYMVQYHGDVKFSGSNPVPASVAARTKAQTENYQIELQVLNSDEEEINRAYIELRENACDTFALNEDVYMSTTNRAVDIYSFAGNYDVAANVLSINNHIVEVGANVRKAGTYIFSMPSDFSGTVELVDSYNGERTNLALSNYEVYLDKGYTGRFTLEINVNKTPTAIDGVEGEGSLKDGKPHKFLQDGLMYILQNGVMYDAQGRRVK